MPINLTLPASPGQYVPPSARAGVVAKALASIAIAEHKKVHPLTLLADDDAAAHVIKAMQGPANTIDPYGNLLTQELTTGLLQSLETECVALRLGLSKSSRVSLDGLNELIFPSRAKGNKNFQGGFRQDGAPIKIGGMMLTADKKIKPHSLSVIGTCTTEMMERSIEDFSAFILRTINEDTSAALDKFVWSTDPATAISPAGLLNGITPVPSVDVASDITNLLKDYVGKDGKPQQAVFIVHPENMIRLKSATSESGGLIYPEAMHNNCIRGVPTIATGHHVPKDKIILIDVYALKMLFEFKGATPSADAALVEESENPVQQGESAAAGQQTRSLFQTGAIALRVMFETDYILTRPTISYVELPAGWGQ
jgi:hypothetical protein